MRSLAPLARFRSAAVSGRFDPSAIPTAKAVEDPRKPRRGIAGVAAVGDSEGTTSWI